MPRPVTFTDLPEHSQRGATIATFPSPDLTLEFPSLGAHLVAAVSEARALGLIYDAGEIRVPLDEGQMEARLATAQRDWDATGEAYERALVDPASIEGWRRSSVNWWANREGLPTVAWPKEES